MNLLYFIMVLVGIIGTGGTCGALEHGNITIPHAIVQSLVFIIILIIGGFCFSMEVDSSES